MRRDLSRQHALLVKLESDWPGAVYDAAPCMLNEREFNNAYLSLDVHRRSAMFSPAEIGPLPDTKQHWVSYRPNSSYGWFCSEPREIQACGIEEIFDEWLRSMHEPRYRELISVAAEIRKSILSISPLGLREVETRVRERIRSRRISRTDESLNTVGEELGEVVEELQVARLLARVGLGVDLLIAQPPQQLE